MFGHNGTMKGALHLYQNDRSIGQLSGPRYLTQIQTNGTIRYTSWRSTPIILIRDYVVMVWCQKLYQSCKIVNKPEKHKASSAIDCDTSTSIIIDRSIRYDKNEGIILYISPLSNGD